MIAAATASTARVIAPETALRNQGRYCTEEDHGVDCLGQTAVQQRCLGD